MKLITLRNVSPAAYKIYTLLFSVVSLDSLAGPGGGYLEISRNDPCFVFLEFLPSVSTHLICGDLDGNRNTSAKIITL